MSFWQSAPELKCFKLHDKILIDNNSIPNIVNLKTINNFDNFKFNEEWFIKNNKLNSIMFILAK